jgi:hypothetical protein
MGGGAEPGSAATLARDDRLFHHRRLEIFLLRGKTMSKQINWYYFRKG